MPADGNDNTARGLTLATLTGEALLAQLDTVARLRIAVFAEWPYLYAGSLDYERWYLSHLSRTPGAVVVLARVGGQAVGAATAMPLAGEHEAFGNAMRAAGQEPADWFYLAESVLLPAHRGQGIGHAFFNAREAEARRQGFGRACFCAVVRPEDHPLRDPAIRPLDGFWRARGYAPLDGAVARFAWPDIGEDAETEKPLQFWVRPGL